MLTKNPSTILGSGLILFSGGVLYLVSRFSTAAEEFRALSPKFFPDLLGWALLFLGGVIFVQGMRRPPAPVFRERPERGAVVRAILFILLVGLYLRFVPVIGFFSVTALFMLLSQALLGEKSIVMNLLRTGVFVFLVNYLFSGLLHVPLPLGPWGF
ncbi:MAG TPA: tripartite tricarboxylate transporter TctB family protein [Aminivibrio sp.]|uniref:tripartite tricarboxylate transporter TctB family protein n=1 Tax=Aminivibrio sp. TaxID=1872489 RepID=UPI002C3F154C|nr:tripartite tricarboxylate transporter TctB family protein [Aminivibrio sp.]HPF84744.1 tripartite tricarboxylate transporter TctB family protein [Aminivibrio sp.]